MGLLTSSSHFRVHFDARPCYRGLDVRIVFLSNELLFYNLNSLNCLLYKVDSLQWTLCCNCRANYLLTLEDGR